MLAGHRIGRRNRARQLAGLWRSYRQDGDDRTSRPVPTAMRRGSAFALRTASAGFEWGKTRPLMFFQKSAEFGVLSSEGHLCVIHTSMVILTMTPLQLLLGSGLRITRLSPTRSRVEQGHQANVCLVNGQPGGV